MSAPATITMSQAASLLGLPKPIHHRQRLCEACGSEDLAWGVEITPASPHGTGFDVELCAACGEPTGARNWIGW